MIVGALVFGKVRVLQTRPALRPAPDDVPAHRVRPITTDNVRGLTDEEVLLLLEDHARRVVEGPDAKLIAPGKISPMPIIRWKMLHRSERGETRETLAAECAELADWIRT